jgi:RNA polymerase sigma-70 factor, ECF subfamily
MTSRSARRQPDAPEKFEALMRRYNSQLFRVARSILKDDADVEDVLQESYLQAYRHLEDFREEAALGTWLTRIVINQALTRLRQQRRDNVVVPFAEQGEAAADRPEIEVIDERVEAPPAVVLRSEIRALIEQKVDELPLPYRMVFVLRDVQDMSVEETAKALSIPSATVRTRLFRARALLRDALARDIDLATVNLFSFAGARCDRIVSAVLAHITQGADS